MSAETPEGFQSPEAGLRCCRSAGFSHAEPHCSLGFAGFPAPASGISSSFIHAVFLSGSCFSLRASSGLCWPDVYSSSCNWGRESKGGAGLTIISPTESSWWLCLVNAQQISSEFTVEVNIGANKGVRGLFCPAWGAVSCATVFM